MGFNINTSAEVGDFLETVCIRVHARNKAVLGRAGLFLGLGLEIPRNFKQADSKGLELAEDTIIGDELGDVVRAALNYRAGTTLDEQQYRQRFRQHFEFGCLELKRIWNESGNDAALFVASLLKIGNFTLNDNGARSEQWPSKSIVSTPVKLTLLRGEEPWTVNSAGGNGLMVISGKPGSGKSQFALDLLMQIARQGVRFLFFDLKGELENNPANPQQQKTRETFLTETRANYLRLIDQSLPINPMPIGKNGAERAQVASEIAAMIRAFAPQLGVNQERSIRDTYNDLETPDFHTLAENLEQHGETGVGLSILEKIDQFNRRALE